MFISNFSPVSGMASIEEEIPSDVDLLDFPILVPHHPHLIEFRLLIQLKCNQVFFPGEEKAVPTRLMISAMPSHLMFHIKEDSKIPLMMMSEGPISPASRGRIFIKFVNVNNNVIRLNCNIIVGYLIIQLNQSF